MISSYRAGSFFYVCLSATLYGLPFVLPRTCWWMASLFLVPLFYSVVYRRLTCADGLVWSLGAFGLNLAAVLQGLFKLAHGPLYIRLLPPLATVALSLFYGLFWWFFSLVLSSYTRTASQRLLVWTLTTILFFIFLDRSSLWVLGRFEGYMLFNPLILLVHVPSLLFFLPAVSSVGLCAIAFVTQASLIGAFLHGWAWKLLMVLTTLFWALSLGIAPWYGQDTFSTDGIVCATGMLAADINITANGRILRDYIKALLARFPYTRLLLLPEGAVKCPFMFHRAASTSLLSTDKLGRSITIITGGFRWDDDERFRNTVYLIRNGLTIDLFDKRHAMAITERHPSLSFIGRICGLKDIYFKSMEGIVPHNRPRPVWHLAEGMVVIPYICSELFFNSSIDHMYSPDSPEGKRVCIIALCNDQWISFDSMRYQMVMAARYRAIEWQLPIIYVAYSYQLVCMTSGACARLMCFDKPV